MPEDILASDIPGYGQDAVSPTLDIDEYDDEPTPSPTPLKRPPVYETPAPTPLTPPVGIGESGAPTPFVERSHVPIDDKTASNYLRELNMMHPGQDDLRAAQISRELDLYAAHEPERRKRAERQYLRDIFTDDEAMKEFADTDDMRQREQFSADPNLERYRAANRLHLEHELGRPIKDDLDYETQRNLVSRERNGKPSTSDSDFYNERRKEYQLDKQLEQARTELIGKGITKAVADQALGQPTEVTSVIDEVVAKYPDAFPTDAARDAAAIVLRDSTAMVRDLTEKLRPDLAVALPSIQKMVNKTATEEDAMALYRLFGSKITEGNRKDVAAILGLAEMALNAQGEQLDRNLVVVELENAKKAFFRDGFGWIPQGNITQQEDQLELARLAIRDGSARIGENGRLIFSPLGEGLPGAPTRGRPLTDTEKTAHDERLGAAMDVMQAQRIVNDAMAKKLDPIEYLGREGTFWGTAERMTLDAIQSAPYMGSAIVAGVLGGLAGGPIGATAASMAMMHYMDAQTQFQDLTINNPELPRETRKSYANWSSAAQLPLNYLEVELFLGRFPVLAGIFKDLKAGNLFGAIVKGGGDLAARQLIEFGAESIQNGISDLTQIIAEDAKSSLPSKMHQVWDQAVENGPRTFFALLPYTLIGTGMAGLHDFGVHSKELLARDGLEAAGYSPAQIDTILAGRTTEERTAALQRETPLRDPATVKAAAARFAQELDMANGAAGAMQQIAGMPLWSSVKKADGTIEYTVKDAAGNVVTTTTSLQQAKLSFSEQAEKAMTGYLLQGESQRAKEEEARQTAEAGAELEILDVEGREVAETSPAATIDFEAPAAVAVIAPDAGLTRLNAKIQKEAPGLDIREVIPSENQTSPVGKTVMNAVRALQSFTGRKVRFIEDVGGNELFFRGVVDPSDPNTIWIDARGTRSTLAIFGHEFTHTLEKTNPGLYAQFVEAVTPFIGDLEVERAKINRLHGGKYKAPQLSKEYLANVVGDAFAHPELMTALAKRNPSLFDKIIAALKQWFQAFKEHASTFGTEASVDVDKIREQVVGLLEKVKAAQAAPAIELSQEDADLQYARNRQTEKGFYSKLENIVDAKIPNSATPEQAKATINGAGIKAEEIKWSGVNQAIDRIATENAGKVPKEKLQAHLEDEGSVKFQEVTLEEMSGERYAELQRRRQEIYGLRDRGGQISITEANRRLNELDREFKSEAPKFGPSGDLILPGGENYREVVLAMPIEKAAPTIRQEGDQWVVTTSDGRTFGPFNTRQGAEYAVEREREAPSQYYTSSHFPNVPNYVAHARMNDRVDAEGKPGLFLEEIQSDRHQAAREKGYIGELSTADWTAKEMGNGIWRVFNKDGEQQGDYRGTSEKDAIREAAASSARLDAAIEGKIPDAPFRNDWPLAMFKRALRDAVATGKEWIGWTVGETQADRYNLAKQVDAIRLTGDFDQAIEVSAVRKGGTSFEHLATTTKDKLSDVVGKEIAKKAIEEGQTEFRGLDLKIGGEGMKGFYDKILPNEVGKYVKQWGGKVESAGISTEVGAIAGGFSEFQDWLTETGQTDVDPMTEWRKESSPLVDQYFEAKRAKQTPIWKVEITPQMKTSVEEGQPLFARKPGKFEQAKAEGPLDRGASIEAIFEQIHGSPQRKAVTTSRAYRAWQTVAARHEAEIAGYQPPEVPDLDQAITELEGQERLARENLDLEEQAEIDASIQAASDEYDGPIADARDAVQRKALEREKRLFLSRKRKGIEAVYAERAKAIANEFAIRRQNVRTTVAQAQTMATAEGSAELKRARRVQTFAELNAILRVIPAEIRGKLGIGMTPSLEGLSDIELTDFLSQRIKAIGRELERSIKADFVEAIEDLLDAAKPKKTKGGVLKGRLADAQRVVDEIRKIKDLNNDQVALEIVGIENQLTLGATPEQDAALHERHQLMLLFGDLSHRTAAELEKSHAVLQAIIQQGRTQWYHLEKTRLLKQQQQADEFIMALGNADPEEIAQMKREEGFGMIAGGFINSHYSFFQFLEQQLPNVSFLKEWANRARRANAASEDFTRNASNRFTTVIQQAVGSKSVLKTGAAVQELQKATVRGRTDVPMTKLEAIQYILSWEQSDVREKMEANGWLQEHMDRLYEATRDPVSTAVRAFLARDYADSWQTLNPTYRAMYGVDMPRIPNYAPSRYHYQGQEQEVNVFGGAAATSGTTPGFVHARINHKAKMRQMDAMHVYMQHMNQVGAFTNFAELIREMRGTLNNAEVKMSLEKSLGSANYRSLNMWIDSMQRNGSNKAAETLALDKMLGYMTKVKAVTSMAFSLKTAVMQVDSAFRFMAEIPLKAWWRTFMDPDFISAIPKVWHSDTIQRRVQEGMSPDVQYLMQQGKLTPTTLMSLFRVGFMHIRYAAGAFDAFSSAAVFKYHYDEQIKAGASPAEAEAYALDKMDAAMQRFSQPTMMTAKGLIGVNGNSLFKMVAMFTSDPMMKTSIMAHAVQQILKGNDVGMNIQRIGSVFVWALVSHTIASIYRDMFTDDEDEEIWTWQGFLQAVALAPLNGWFMAGPVAESILGRLTGEYVHPKNSDVLMETFNRAERAAKHYEDALNFDDYPAMIKEWDNILKTLAVAHPVATAAAGMVNAVKPVAGVIANIKESE